MAGRQVSKLGPLLALPNMTLPYASALNVFAFKLTFCQVCSRLLGVGTHPPVCK